ncbi:MAG: hypothetical protein ACRERC_09895 [Candidatus Binatia bacterium]
MIPSLPTTLNGLARTLMMDLAPQLQNAYAGQTLQISTALLMMAAQEFDRAAARLVEENDALLALFASATGVVADDALRAALTDAAAGSSTLLVSALHERNRALRAVLVRLHAHVESLPGDAARLLEARIWTELAESTRRRQLDLAIG